MGIWEERARPPTASFRQPEHDAISKPSGHSSLLLALSGACGWHANSLHELLLHPCPPKQTITKCSLEPPIIFDPNPHLQGRHFNPGFIGMETEAQRGE